MAQPLDAKIDQQTRSNFREGGFIRNGKSIVS